MLTGWLVACIPPPHCIGLSGPGLESTVGHDHVHEVTYHLVEGTVGGLYSAVSVSLPNTPYSVLTCSAFRVSPRVSLLLLFHIPPPGYRLLLREGFLGIPVL